MDPKLIVGRLQSMLEAGRVLSAANEAKVRAAITALQTLLSQVAKGEAADARTATESARQALEEAMSYDERESAVRDAVKARFQSADPRQYVWVYLVDCFDDYAICNVEIDYSSDASIGDQPLPPPSRKTYQVSYSISPIDSTVTLGEPVEVRKVVSYVPVTQQESADVELTGDLVPLVEKSVGSGGTVPIKIIAPGWGSSGYYPAAVLEKSASAFPKGLHMHVDHPTAAEEVARPERSVSTIGAVLETDARWEPNGVAGPGLYAECKPIGDFAQRLPELAPHIGVSIRALGKATQGEAEGRRGPIIQEIASAKSVDFVTVAGAGGKVLELFEAARGRLTVPQSGREERQVNEQEAQALHEAAAAKDTENARLAEANANLTTENARLREGALLREARDVVVETLAAIQLPDLTRARLTEALAAKPIVKDGALDRDAYKVAIAEAAKVELEYIAKLTGQGQVKGMGSAAPVDKPSSLKESWLNVYRAQGLSEAEAERRASIAAI